MTAIGIDPTANSSEEHSALAPENPEGRPGRRKSLLQYAPALVLLLIVVADSAQFPDSDLWGHLRFGQAAIASGHVVVRDPYSYSAAGGVWRNHEWLSEIVMASLYNTLGVVGLKLWKFGCVAMTMVLMTLGMAETGASPSIQLNTLAIAALAMVLQNQFRPQLFTFMLLAAMLTLLARHNYRGHAPLWLVIPIMALWGNLHGGFIIGIATLAVYTVVTGVKDLIAGLGLSRALRLGLITLAGTLATLISPYGIDAWLVVLNALRNSAAHPIIADWQPLLHAISVGWHTKPADAVFFLCGLLAILAFAIVVVVKPHGGDLPLVAIAAMLCVAAFTAVRNLPLAMIACAAPLARHAELIAVRRRRDAPASGIVAESAAIAPSDDRSGIKPWLAVSIAIVLAVIGGLFSSRLVVDTDLPVGAVAFMHEHNLHGNVLSNFADGEYLIWHLPDSRVFIDGRYDTVYPQKIIHEYLDFINARPEAMSVLRAYPHDFVLLPSNSRALIVIRQAPEWTLIYRDENWTLFARTSTPAANLPDNPGIERFTPGRMPGLPDEPTRPAVSYFP
jgi:hypothetical protein